MKKIFLFVALAAAMISCNDKSEKTATSSETKESKSGNENIVYIDTEKLMKEYKESVDFESKFKAMSEKMQSELEGDMKKFQNDVMDLQKNAQSKGMEWAQQREAELGKRQQTLAQKEQNYMKKFQEESAVERDSLVSKMKKFIKTYGAEKGYDYVLGTGDASTVLYAKEGSDITEEVLKLMNEAYENKSTSTETPEVKKETKK
ncbi:OmpH family outer membrane protein [Flavobacterium sp. I3-2]|uniref:OmpH family outer membrane protein n=1 Tax=Flavobacterium sp. I3-2 TaxID=2748319 RepID=UPI0015A8D3EA|nr:OmpH family outer membrane protein [Flavobacterium sp. I3-2]